MIDHTRTVEQSPARQQPQPCLVVLSGAQKGQAFWIERQEVRIGRSDDSDVRLDDASVSRHHATLLRGPESWLLTDHDSKNGSFLGERPVAAGTSVRDGDLLRFGSVALQFFMVQAVGDAAIGTMATGGLSVDPATMSAAWRGRTIELTETEYRMLAALMRRPGRVLSSLALMRAAYPREHVVAESTVASHLRNLRRKLDELSGGSELIRSYYGRGYALSLAEAEPGA